MPLDTSTVTPKNNHREMDRTIARRFDPYVTFGLRRAYLGLGSVTWALATDGNVALRSAAARLPQKALSHASERGVGLSAAGKPSTYDKSESS